MTQTLFALPSMPTHPDAERFPRMSDREIAELADSIATEGLKEPIVTVDGAILDGRNRFEACRLAKVQPQFVEWDGQGSPLRYVVARNLFRRHLKENQRSAIAAECLEVYEREAKEKQRQAGIERQQARRQDKVSSHTPDEPGVKLVANLPQATGEPKTPAPKARDQAAADFNVSPRQVQGAKSVMKADPELFERVKAGEVSVNKALKTVQESTGPLARLASTPQQAEQYERKRLLAAYSKRVTEVRELLHLKAEYLCAVFEAGHIEDFHALARDTRSWFASVERELGSAHQLRSISGGKE